MTKLAGPDALIRDARKHRSLHRRAITTAPDAEMEARMIADELKALLDQRAVLGQRAVAAIDVDLNLVMRRLMQLAAIVARVAAGSD